MQSVDLTTGYKSVPGQRQDSHSVTPDESRSSLLPGTGLTSQLQQKQQGVLRRLKDTLVSFSMNVPGLESISPDA